VRRGRGPTCIGQKQRWFLLRLALPENAVEFDFKRTNEPEFDGWRWANYWSRRARSSTSSGPVYVHMLEELAAVAFPGGAPPKPEWWSSENAVPSRNNDTMPGLPPKLVVTTYAPTRRWITIIVCC